MSVLELTLSYSRSVADMAFEAPSLSSHQKHNVILASFGVFVASVAFYLFLSGSVVSKNYERDSMMSQLQQSSSRAQEIEQRALSADSVYTSQYFLEHGYEEPKDLGIIKRSKNVAEVSNSNIY